MRERFRIFRHSIRFRLALWFVVILAAVLAAFSVFVYVRQRYDLRNETVDRLELKTRQWESYLKYGAGKYFDENRSLIPAETQDGEPFLQDRDILALVGVQGQVVQKAGSITDADIQELIQTGKAGQSGSHPFSYPVIEATTQGETVREEYFFVAAPVSVERRVIGFLVLGSPVDPTGQLPRLLITLILGNLAMLGLALAGGYWLADRAMRPVKTITRAAREIGETDLSRRLNLGTRDELGELADTFDGMLGRLQAAFNRQRQFTADASHELRTPLSIIGLEASRALATRRTAPEYQRALAVIQSENGYMARLVNNLLTLSRMDAGEAVLNFEDVDLSDVALDVVERLAPLADRRGVAIRTGELPELKVSGDRQYLSQMVANLVENAIKYSRQEGGMVQVETGRDGAELPGYGWLRVEDNGPGIAPEHLPHLFDRFYQVDRARSHNRDEFEGGSEAGPPVLEGQATAGSGLGLSIVQWIAQAHGGEVAVQSQAGQGAMFTVQLPLAGLS